MPEPSSQHNLPADPPLWRNFSFTLMWTSTAASGFGDRMIMLAAQALLGGLVEGIANRSGIQAGTQFWFFLPYILFSVPAGWLADRVSRKWLMLACDEFRGGILLLAFVLVADATGAANIPSDYHWRVYAILFAVGVFAATFNPTRNAVVPQLVPSSQLQGANAIINSINIIAALIGMLIGTHIIHAESASSVRAGLIWAALFYMVSGTFFAFLRLRGQSPAAPLNRPKRQLATPYILAHRRILLLIGLNILVWSAAATVTCTIMGLGSVRFAMGANENFRFAGALTATLGVGMLVGAGFVSVFGSRRESDLWYLKGIAMAGVSILLLALVRVQWLCFPAVFGTGFFGSIAIITLITVMQTLSPNYMRGRVMGVNSMANTALSVVIYFIIWKMPNADATLVGLLYILGPVLILVGVAGLWRQLTRGPLPSQSLNFLWHVGRAFVLIWHRVEWVGKHNVPRTGPVLLAANHTAGVDPFLVQSAIPRLVKWVMISTYRFRIANWAWKRIDPIVLAEHGAELTKVRAIIHALKDGQIVGLFPEGQLQREVRELNPFQAGIGMIAQRTGAAIVPVWIEGTPQVHSMLGHFFLPSHSRVIFGKPFKADPNATHEQVVEELRQRMIKLAKGG